MRIEIDIQTRIDLHPLRVPNMEGNKRTLSSSML